ncbi:MAG TPA: hydroxymethylbilane synthase, partial [Gemmatimonadales bacterium]|nr:hydroxymethylbilane synthase [Gemmatimonadales bacterium]
LRVGTRASALALWQTERVRALLDAAGVATERIEITTTGDAVRDVPLSRIGTRGLFTRQLDEAMLEGRIDLAVHSLKDLPTRLPAGIALAAVSDREDPRDALVGRGPLAWAVVPEGATIATGSLRRRAQLLRARPDLGIAEIRGNVDTRLAKLDARPEWTAVVLASAGLDRLGFAHRIGERLPLTWMLPAPGQGALAVTARADDAAAQEVAQRVVEHAPTAIATAAERAFLRRLEGGCSVPVAAYAEAGPAEQGGGYRLTLSGRVTALDGTEAAEGVEGATVRDAAEADAVGLALAERLIAGGADLILAAARIATGTAEG